MKNANRGRYFASIMVLGVSAAFWGALLLISEDIIAAEHNHSITSGSSMNPFKILLASYQASSFMTGWILMVLAMMLPKLITPIQHISEKSLPRNSLGNILLFIVGYTTVWAVAGLILNGIILFLNLLTSSPYIPALVGGIVALIWQFSPVKQIFLNRSHNLMAIRAFGWTTTSIDSMCYGMVHGLWCIGSGWALMLFPMLLPKGHVLAMLVVSFIMISEHLERPRIPRWHIDLRLKLFRIMIAQLKIRTKLISSKFPVTLAYRNGSWKQ